MNSGNSHHVPELHLKFQHTQVHTVKFSFNPSNQGPQILAPLCQYTHDCICAGRLVTLHTLYFRLMVPQCVISIFSPLISLVNLTLWESVRGLRCSFMSRMSKTSHMNSITGCAL